MSNKANRWSKREPGSRESSTTERRVDWQEHYKSSRFNELSSPVAWRAFGIEEEEEISLKIEDGGILYLPISYKF